MSQESRIERDKAILASFTHDTQDLEEIASVHGVSASTVRRVIKSAREKLEVQADGELVDENIRLGAGRQRLQDSNRIERKAWREHIRIQNAIQGYSDVLWATMVSGEFKFVRPEQHPVPAIALPSDPVGVIQFSDTHINEIIRGLTGNTFDIDIASRRIHKHVKKSLALFDAQGVKHVVIAFTGDILNSDRRLDEVLNAAAPRANAVLLAVDIFQQAIQDVAREHRVTVASITGNESRLGEHIHWDDFLALDSFDITIHNMLKRLFADYPGVTFSPITNPLEQVVNINGFNLLLVHGHGHKGLARNPESEVSHIKSRYAAHGVVIDYVICGHIHSAYVSDMFSRSSGLPGSNAYSDRALNLNGKASQNSYVIWSDKSIDAYKIDLQEVANVEPYGYDKTLDLTDRNSKLKPTVLINSITI
uniref:3',5'-cyclic adenosine monophosphate phosphodiesterase CpdA n=1 Tax=Pseudomonas phage Cygsa01 TaxID=3138529 RepID=A0AAU6W386_9VIRU